MKELTLNEVLAGSQPTKQEHRFGIIQVSSPFLDELISISMTDTQGKLRDEGVFTRLHKRLLLPASYSIYGVFYNYWLNVWEICVASPDLPIVPEYETPPVIMPVYRRNEDGTNSLAEIKIENRWQRTYSPEELTIERL